jgi:transcriptional regulator GlxA family with amidase domain
MSTAALPTPAFTIVLLAFDGMEVLDFAGPFEVFTTASRVHAKLNETETAANKSITTSARTLFDVKSVARTHHAVQARAGLRMWPDAGFATPLQADLLLVPGGVVDRAMACPDTLAWVRHMHATSRWTASVCTGAFILAQAGVLTHQHVTTHWEDQADLQHQFPALRVQSGVRWVEAEDGTDGGRITTSAGISAGIDMSLHLVATMADNHMRALGLDGHALATRTAHQMEYTWTQPVPPPQTC